MLKMLSKGYWVILFLNIKISRLLLLIFSLLIALNVSAAEDHFEGLQLSQEEQTWLKNHPKIIMGVDGRWPPIDFYDLHGRHSGVLNDYLDYLGKILKVEFIPKRFDSFKTMVVEVGKGNVPVAATLVKTERRAKNLWFTTPYFSSRKVILSNRNIELYPNLTSLYGKSLAIEKGFYMIDILAKEHPKINLKIFDDTEKSVAALAMGKVDAYIGSQSVSSWFIRNHQYGNLTVSSTLDKMTADLSFAIHKDPEWKIFVDIFNRALKQFPVQQQQKILENWLAYKNHQAGNPQKGFAVSEQERNLLTQFSPFIMGVGSNWPPFNMITEDHQYIGISAEFNQAIAQRLGINYQVKWRNTWQETIDDFKAGRVDAISSVHRTKSRKEYMVFTKPYLVHPYMVLVNKDSKFVSSLADLEGKTVAVVKGWAIGEILRRQQPKLKLQIFNNVEDALLAVSSGSSDSFIGILTATSWLIDQLGIQNIKVTAATPYTFEQTIALQPKYADLIPLFNRAIDSIPSYQRQRIKNNWMQVEFSHQVSDSKLIRAVALTFIIVFPIILIFMFWNRKLNIAKNRLENSQKELAIAKTTAEQASEFKSQFLANMSHEIRTPMNAIMGINHLMIKTDLTDQQKDYSEKIKNSAANLLNVINDILDFSKVEAGRLDINKSNFDLTEVLADLASVLSLKAAEQGVEVLFEFSDKIPNKLIGDAMRLGQILINLTQNAIKFTEQGYVIVEVSLHEDNHSEMKAEVSSEQVSLQFSIKDTGIGIEQDQLQRLFKPFTQVDGSNTRKYGGTGLGLHISRQLINLMGGEIKAESEVDVGSHFYFYLPFSLQQDVAQKPYLVSDDIQKTSIVILADASKLSLSLESMISSFSQSHYSTDNKQQALEWMQQKESPLLIVDWRVAGESGNQALEYIRQSLPKESNCKIILLGVYGSEVQQINDQHAYDVLLVKPVLANKLIQSIGNLYLGDEEKECDIPVTQCPQFALEGQVLVVEDNDINQMIILELLQSLGLTADTANNGKEAVFAVQQKSYDLVLMDIQMPIMDGFQATQNIRKLPHLKKLPIIAMTAHALQEDRERCISIGMDGHIAKPIDPKVFYALLNQWLSKKTPDCNSNSASCESLSQQEQLHTLSQLDTFDVAKGLARLGGNQELYLKLLTRFVQTHRDDMAKVAELLSIDELAEAKAIVHTIRGVATNLGAKDFEKDAMDLEMDIRNVENGIKTQLSSYLLQRFYQSFTLLFDSLITMPMIMRTIDHSEQNQITKDYQDHRQQSRESRQTLLDLQELLAKGDTRCQKYSEQLPNLLEENNAEQLAALIEDFEFSKAYQMLKQLLQAD